MAEQLERFAVVNRLFEKVAIVTGGGRGIGAAFCEALASEGAKVVVADVIDGNDVARRITDAGGNAIYRKVDVTSQTSIEALIAGTNNEYGEIDVLVNNAGLFAGIEKRPFQEIETEEWDRVMIVNVRGSFQCAKAVAPSMIKRQRGKIINIASGTVFKGFANMLHYVASKGAVVAMTRSLARELGSYNVCVNAVAPGLTMSDAVQADPEWTGEANARTIASRAIKRNQVPADLLGTLIYLASSESDFVTGQTIVVDGGSVMR